MLIQPNISMPTSAISTINRSPLFEQWVFVAALICQFSVVVSGLFAILAVDGHTESAEARTYFLGFSIGLLLATYVVVAAHSKQDSRFHRFAKIATGYSYLYAIAAIVLFAISWGEEFPITQFLILLVVYPVLVAATTIYSLSLQKHGVQLFDTFAFASLAVFISGPAAALFSIYFRGTPDVDFTFERLIVLSTQFSVVVGCLAFITVFILGIALERFPAAHRVCSSRPIAAIYLMILIITGSLFIYTSLDGGTNLHYSAFVGPAVAVNAGLFPMTEVISQYGLGYLIYSLFFPILPRTPGSIILITQVLNLFYMSVIGWTIYRMASNKVIGMAMGVFFVFDVMFASWQTGLNNMPSLQALRYLPSYLILWGLTTLPKDRDYTRLTIAIAVIASLWSLDSFATSLATYLLFVSARRLKLGQTSTYAPWLLTCGKLLGLFILPHAAIAIIGFLATAKWPDYVAYLQIVQSHTASEIGVPVYFNDVTTLVKWTTLIPETFWLWVVVALTYVGSVGLALREIVSGEESRRNPDAPLLGAAGIAGISAMAMFVGRSIPATIYVGSGSFYILIACALSWTVNLFSGKQVPGLRLWIVRGATISALAGIIAPRLLMITALLPYPWQGFVRNNILEHGPDTYVEIWKDLNSKDRLERDLVNLGTNKARVVESIAIINRYMAERPDVLIFAPEAWLAMYLTNKTSSLGIANNFNDLLSARLRCQALRATEKLQQGQIVIIYRDLDRLFLYDQQLIQHLFAAWDARLIEQTNVFNIFRLERRIPPLPLQGHPSQPVQITTSVGLSDTPCGEVP